MQNSTGQPRVIATGGGDSPRAAALVSQGRMMIRTIVEEARHNIEQCEVMIEGMQRYLERLKAWERGLSGDNIGGDDEVSKKAEMVKSSQASVREDDSRKEERADQAVRPRAFQTAPLKSAG